MPVHLQSILDKQNEYLFGIKFTKIKSSSNYNQYFTNRKNI